jgi:hypothetical protein
MCEMLVKLVLHNYMFATYVNNYFLQMLFLDSSGGNVNYPVLMMFSEHLVYSKVVYNSCV